MEEVKERAQDAASPPKIELEAKRPQPVIDSTSGSPTPDESSPTPSRAPTPRLTSPAHEEDETSPDGAATAEDATQPAGPHAQVAAMLTSTVAQAVSEWCTSPEIKNVKSLSYTLQIQDSLSYANANKRVFDLYVRGNPTPTRMSGPLCDEVRKKTIILKLIPDANGQPGTGREQICPAV